MNPTRMIRRLSPATRDRIDQCLTRFLEWLPTLLTVSVSLLVAAVSGVFVLAVPAVLVAARAVVRVEWDRRRNTQVQAWARTAAAADEPTNLDVDEEAS
jgi:hypothetical protein